MVFTFRLLEGVPKGAEYNSRVISISCTTICTEDSVPPESKRTDCTPPVLLPIVIQAVRHRLCPISYLRIGCIRTLPNHKENLSGLLYEVS